MKEHLVIPGVQFKITLLEQQIIHGSETAEKLFYAMNKYLYWYNYVNL